MPRLLAGKLLPVTAYDKDGVRMLLNFASDCPPGRPDVLVMVVSMLNTAPLPVHNVLLQAAVPKVQIRSFMFCLFYAAVTSVPLTSMTAGSLKQSINMFFCFFIVRGKTFLKTCL